MCKKKKNLQLRSVFIIVIQLCVSVNAGFELHQVEYNILATSVSEITIAPKNVKHVLHYHPQTNQHTVDSSQALICEDHQYRRKQLLWGSLDICDSFEQLLTHN